jgi:hypothetical protein
MEDDVVFTTAMKTSGEAMVEELLTIPWHFAYLGHYAKVPPGAHGSQHHDGFLAGGHCLAISVAILERLLAYMEEVQHHPPGHPEGGRIAPDVAYNRFRAVNPDVITLTACPSLAEQGSSRSDLHPAWFDRVPLLRGPAHSARGALAKRRGLGFAPWAARSSAR